MTSDDPPVDPVLEPLLKQGKTIPPVPCFVRARAVARARAAVATMGLGRTEPAPVRRKSSFAIVMAASMALAAGGAIAALLGQAAETPKPASQVRRAAAPPSTLAGLAFPPAVPTARVAPTVPAESGRPAKPSRFKRSTSAEQSYAAELELLERAQAAYASRDFGLALILVAEHGQRFQNGGLAEEREALRVQSLASSGRTDEAARAAAMFADRFPRSVLLPLLGSEPR